MNHYGAPMKPRKFPGTLPLQIGLVATGLTAAVIAPPANGVMMLVPVTASTGSALNLAMDRHARFLGAGPIPGSLIVEGRRDALWPAMLGSGTMLLAARADWCGGGDA